MGDQNVAGIVRAGTAFRLCTESHKWLWFQANWLLSLRTRPQILSVGSSALVRRLSAAAV